MKGWNVFAEIKKLKKMGLKKSQVSRSLNIDYKTVTKYWGMTHDEYAKCKDLAAERRKQYDPYKSDILEWIQEFHDLSSAQVHDWLKEKYQDFNENERTLRHYVQSLRKEYNIPKKVSVRQYEVVEEMPIGYQAQVDLGEIWVKRYDDVKIKVYCFAIVLSHSRYKFICWQEQPFTTKTFIEAHNKAFSYFGGMPKEVVYDQDRILMVSENYGDIIYTKDFQAYLEYMKFKTRVCRAYNPESKGKVEAVVKYAKMNFAKHRTFYDGIDFNEDCIKWLERTGNGKLHETTKKIPAQVFKTEREYLMPLKTFKTKHLESIVTYPVRKDNVVLYKQNRYQVPKGTYTPGKYVEIKIEDNRVGITDTDTKEKIVSHALSAGKGDLIRIIHPERPRNIKIENLYKKTLQSLGSTKEAKELLDDIRTNKSRYTKDQYGLILEVMDTYALEDIQRALVYCINRKLYSASMFKAALEYLKIEDQKDDSRKEKSNTPIPSKYKNVTPQVRSIQAYVNTLKGAKKCLN